MSTIYLQGLLQTTALISPGRVSAILKAPKFSLTQPKVTAVGPTLRTLALSSSSVTENTAAGTIIGTIVNTTSGSTITMGPGADAGGRVTTLYQTGTWYLVTTSTPFDYETASSYAIDLVETLSPAIGSPKTTSGLTLAVANQNDTNPNAFSFTDASSVPLSTVETSNTITVAGLGATDTASAAISGDPSSQMQVNGGAWGAGPATVVNGDTIVVRHTSSGTNNTVVSTTLTVGTTSDTFTSTTVAVTFIPMSGGLNLSELYPWYAFQNPFQDIFQSQSIYCVGTSFTATGTTTLNGKTISGISDMTNMHVGMGISGAGIPGLTLIDAVDVAGSSITISQKASASGTVTLSVTYQGQAVPDAYRDAKGWPNAYPPGVTQFQVLLGMPAVQEPYLLQWDGQIGAGIDWHFVTATGTQNANSQQFTPYTIADYGTTSQHTWFYYKLGASDYPRNIKALPVTNDGKVTTAAWRAKACKLIGTGPLRVTRATTVEDNGFPSGLVDPAGDYTFSAFKFPTDGDGLLRQPILTGANRNTPTNGAEWWTRRDGVPFPVWVKVCNELAADLGRPVDLWFPIAYNSDATYRQAIANDAANGFDPANGWGPLLGNLFSEVGNEPWNGNGYTFYYQLQKEGLDLGYGPDTNVAARRRYATQAAVYLADMKSVFDAAGKTAKFKRVLAGHAAEGSNLLTDQLGWTSASDFDYWSVAGYYNPNSTTYPSSYTGDVVPLINSMYAGADAAYALSAAHKATAVANGLLFHHYEEGPGTSYDNQSTVDAIHTNAAFKPLVSYGLNEKRRLGLPGNYFNMGVPWGTGDHEYGLLPKITDPIDSTRPAAQAVSEAMVGNYTMFDPTISATDISGGASAGDSVAKFTKGLLPEATLTLTDPSGLFDVDSTVTNGVANLKSKTTHPAPGTYAVTLIQTYNNPVTGVQTHSTNYNITVHAIPTTAFNPATSAAEWVLSNGNRTATRNSTSAGANRLARSDTAATLGYAEFHIDAQPVELLVGFGAGSMLTTDWGGAAGGVALDSNGTAFYNGSAIGATGSYTTGDTIGVCIKNGKAYFRKNGVWLRSANPDTETNGIVITGGIPGAAYLTVSGAQGGAAVTINCGQSAFRDPPPAGTFGWPT